MSRVNASQVLANGLRTEFADTYTKIKREVDSRLASVMDLSVGATNRVHEFAYFESGAHAELWPRGGEIRSKGMDSVKFTATVQEYGKRVPWLGIDRQDDQTSSLMDAARQAGESFAQLPERMFFELIRNSASLLPSIPTAPDGAAMFATTDGGGSARFGATNGNLLTGSGATAADIRTDFYTALEQFMLFQDTEGQPLLNDMLMQQPFILIHPVQITEAMEEAFVQKQQLGDSTAGGARSNIMADSAKRVTLWPSPRLTDANDWFLFLGSPPKQATFWMERQGVTEETALVEDNNSDHVRDTGEEYIQWHSRSGAGIALPYGAIKVANS